MKAFLDTWCTLAAAILLAAAGIFEVIDQTTMITLIIVLIVCMPSMRRGCLPARRAG